MIGMTYFTGVWTNFSVAHFLLYFLIYNNIKIYNKINVYFWKRTINYTFVHTTFFLFVYSWQNNKFFIKKVIQNNSFSLIFVIIDTIPSQ